MGRQAWGFSMGRGSKGVVRLTLDEGEIRLLSELLGQLIELVEPSGADAETAEDPLAAMVGIGTATSVPDDPALARLLPDAYPDDPERAAEFRRYTELSLRERKRQQAEVARATLDGSAASGLSREETTAWLLALNDLRLTLGTRLDVSEDHEQMWATLAELPEDDPRLFMHHVYDWLTGLQGTLLHALDR